MQGKAAVYTLDAVINDSNLGHKFRHLKKVINGLSVMMFM